MPLRLQPQILNHNPGEHDNLSIPIIQHRAVRQVQPIRDLGRDPAEILMRVKQRKRIIRIPRVDFLQPRRAARMVRVISGPRTARKREVPVSWMLGFADGENGFQRLAHPDDGGELYERFAQPPHEGLARCGVWSDGLEIRCR